MQQMLFHAQTEVSSKYVSVFWDHQPFVSLDSLPTRVTMLYRVPTKGQQPRDPAGFLKVRCSPP